MKLLSAQTSYGPSLESSLALETKPNQKSIQEKDKNLFSSFLKKTTPAGRIGPASVLVAANVFPVIHHSHEAILSQKINEQDAYLRDDSISSQDSLSSSSKPYNQQQEEIKTHESLSSKTGEMQESEYSQTKTKDNRLDEYTQDMRKQKTSKDSQLKKSVQNSKEKSHFSVSHNTETTPSKEELLHPNSKPFSRLTEEERLDSELFRELEKTHFSLSEKGQTKDTEGLVRLVLDADKWKIQRAPSLDKEGRESLSLGVKVHNGVQGKDTREKGQGNGEGNKDDSLLGDSSEQLSSLFSTEKKAEQSNRSFIDKLQKEDMIRENRRLYDRLVQKAKVNLRSDGSSTASIRLRPQALGRITLNLEVNQNQVHVQLIVETQVAKDLLAEELNHFQQELQRQGIQFESLSIRVREPRDPLGSQLDENDANQSSHNEQKDAEHESDQRSYRDLFPEDSHQEPTQEIEESRKFQVANQNYEQLENQEDHLFFNEQRIDFSV